MDLTEIVVGVITRAHGVRGEVAVSLRTDEPERRFAVGQVLRAEPGSGRTGGAPGNFTPNTFTPNTFTVVRTRDHQGRWLVTFAELTDRNAAEAARGIRLVADVPADERPADDEEYYDRQLVGLSVRLQGVDGPIGTVKSVLHLPAQDVLEIRTDHGIRMVPFVSELVPEIDLETGRVLVADVAGLLDDDLDEADDQEQQR
ncbi:ribosome maturation factor RimM [Microlunatus elymi]|uniref:Ribosome maturation factor RimM n=1 Tax=Microlunatus elymi TaxID=2596828 RepID=A0A516PYR7_9ACTN|nr:ribosome maturation factor RimM [Microlunatus elymi]QDP96329.1 ribosome maturation factor RimM [Microlunatus elymi]